MNALAVDVDLMDQSLGDYASSDYSTRCRFFDAIKGAALPCRAVSPIGACSSPVVGAWIADGSECVAGRCRRWHGGRRRARPRRSFGLGS
jgi:hypothetical protein